MTQAIAEKDSFVSNFQEFERQRNGNVPGWLAELRRAGISRFEAVGFPSAREEEWRFTNIRPITTTKFTLAAPRVDDRALERFNAYTFGNDALAELVFINGHFAPRLSHFDKLPRGVTLKSLHDATTQDEPVVRQHLGRCAKIDSNAFVALNSGFVRDGAFLHVARNVVVDRPIHLLFIDTGDGEPTVSHPRILIVLEENAQATVVKSFVGAGSVHLANVVTEIVLGDNARLDHNKLQHDCAAAYHVSMLQAKLGRGANLISHAATIGSRITRNDLNVTLAGEGAEAILNGLVIIGGHQHCDNHTLLEHAAPNCPSHELYKHVLRDEASGVFKGKIFVHQAAQKTDSKQTSKSLLLSDDAQMNSQPALEIYADDVKCTHGSTTGPVDEDMVFYLRSRGVSLEAARHLLTYAFAADITRRIKVEKVRSRLEDFMAAQAGLPQDLRITDLGEANEQHRT